jgi:hypothetical protein
MSRAQPQCATECLSTVEFHAYCGWCTISFLNLLASLAAA